MIPEEWRLIEALRVADGNGVSLMIDDPDEDDCLYSEVMVCGEWTAWKDLTFRADTLLGALRQAHAALKAATSAPPTDEAGADFTGRRCERLSTEDKT